MLLFAFIFGKVTFELLFIRNIESSMDAHLCETARFAEDVQLQADPCST